MYLPLSGVNVITDDRVADIGGGPALHSNLVWLSLIGLVNSAVAAYYYLRLIVVMYMREPAGESAPIPVAPETAAALLLAAIATIYLGTVPTNVLYNADRGARVSFRLPAA